MHFCSEENVVLKKCPEVTFGFFYSLVFTFVVFVFWKVIMWCDVDDVDIWPLIIKLEFIYKYVSDVLYVTEPSGSFSI